MPRFQFDVNYIWLRIYCKFYKYLRLYCPLEWWIIAVGDTDNKSAVCALVEVQWIDVTAIHSSFYGVQIGGKGNLKDRVATCDCLEGIQI